VTKSTLSTCDFVLNINNSLANDRGSRASRAWHWRKFDVVVASNRIIIRTNIRRTDQTQLKAGSKRKSKFSFFLQLSQFLLTEVCKALARTRNFNPFQSFTMPNGSGTNSQGNHYNTPGGTNSSGGSSYHCEYDHAGITF
jgi:hypothetical protein